MVFIVSQASISRRPSGDVIRSQPNELNRPAVYRAVFVRWRDEHGLGRGCCSDLGRATTPRERAQPTPGLVALDESCAIASLASRQFLVSDRLKYRSAPDACTRGQFLGSERKPRDAAALFRVFRVVHGKVPFRLRSKSRNQIWTNAIVRTLTVGDKMAMLSLRLERKNDKMAMLSLRGVNLTRPCLSASPCAAKP
jgi:hypothetical protein